MYALYNDRFSNFCRKIKKEAKLKIIFYCQLHVAATC